MREKGFTRTNFATQNSRGFTLIEILVVATIIAVLSIVGVASFTSINKRSRDAKRKSDLQQVRSALEMYRIDNGSYPGSSADFHELSADLGVLVPTYVPSIPTDPKNTALTPVFYFYSPLGGAGIPLRFYGYCICADLESQAGIDNTCGVTLPAACNYGLKNP